MKGALNYKNIKYQDYHSTTEKRQQVPSRTSSDISCANYEH